MESLGTGKTFYLHTDPTVLKPTFTKPEFLANAKVEFQKDVPKAKFASRPDPNWPVNQMKTIDVVMNSFDCEGEITNSQIYLWTVEFDPHVADGPERWKTVNGYSFRERQSNRDKLKGKFGRYVTDNLMMYSEGKPEGNIIEFPAGRGDDSLNQNHSVKFSLSEGPINLTDEGLTYEQCEQILNVFTRDMMEVAGYGRLHGSAFFRNKNTPTDLVQARGDAPNLKIMRGFECNIKVTADERQPYKFKADLYHKLLWEDTLHITLEKLKAKAKSLEELKSLASRKFVGKFFVLTYGTKKSLKVASLDWSKNQQSCMNPNEPNPQTFRQYYEGKYKINASLPEMCVVVTRDGNCYLPQHVNFTVISSEAADIYEQAMAQMTPHISQRMQTIVEFIQEIQRSKASLQPTDQNRAKMITLSNKPNTVKAATFDAPKIIMQGRNGAHAVTLNNFKPADWGRNTCGLLPPLDANGRPKQIVKMSSLAILFSQGEARGGGDISNTLGQYINKRGFKSGNPWARPEEVNVGNWRSSNNFGQFLRSKRTGKFFTHAIVVIPEGTEGSEIKTRLTKQAQMSRQMTNTQLQFVRVSCTGNRVKVMGALENLLTKSGYILYRIDPGIEAPRLKAMMLDKPGKSWMMGLDVSHNGTSKPSVCTLSINRDVFSGSLGSVEHSVWCNPPRKEVIGYKQMIGFFYESLEHIWNNRINKDKNQLPECLWLFRDGLSEGQLHESMSKEYNGIQRACREFSRNNGIKLETLKNGKKKSTLWKPKIQFIVVQKRILDRIGVMNRGRLDNPRDAVVVYDTCLEKKLWDFVAWFNTKGKNRPLRYIVLKDDLGIAKDHQNVLAFFKLIYATTFLYPFSLPFTMGNVNQPGVVKLAKHYSELWSQMIFSSDQSFDSLETNPKLNRPHLFYKGKKGNN